MRILHVCNWVGGITTRNVAALKQFSVHSHELVTRLDHCYDMATEPAHLTEKNTTREMVEGLAEEADVLHFHAAGYDGTVGLPETIHGIDWSKFKGKKLFVLHGMVSDLQPDGSWIKRHADRFEVRNLGHYDALMGPHLSCKKSYEQRLLYVPDMIPVNDWLYTPVRERSRLRMAATFKDPAVAFNCQHRGLDVRLLPTPSKLTEQLAWRRRNCRATFDNSTDGHWGLFGIESLSQGVPSVAFTHPLNLECWSVLGVPPPPFFDCKYGGDDVPSILEKILNQTDAWWNVVSERARSWVETYYAPFSLVHRWDAAYGMAVKP